jgi:hypothetical protein
MLISIGVDRGDDTYYPNYQIGWSGLILTRYEGWIELIILSIPFHSPVDLIKYLSGRLLLGKVVGKYPHVMILTRSFSETTG